MRSFLSIFPLLLLLAACGKSDDTSSSAAAPATVNQTGTVVQTSNTYSMTTGITGSGNAYYAAYQFKENGCDTEIHPANGPYPEVPHQLICGFLLNEQMNHSCARDLRYAYWNSFCH